MNYKYRRVGLLDEVRGLCIAGVVLFHVLYNLIYIYNFNISFPGMKFIFEIIQPLGAGAFIFISGIVSRYSKNNIKRGAVTFGLGLGITLVTGLVIPSSAVKFGILSLLGSAMLIYGLLDLSPYIRNMTTQTHKPLIFGTALFALFVLSYGVPYHFLGIFMKPIAALPQELYMSNWGYAFGFPSPAFFSSDFFPLIPWAFLFISGTFFGLYFREDKMPEFFYKNYLSPLKWMGKHSLLIYIIHQPVVMAIMAGLDFIF